MKKTKHLCLVMMWVLLATSITSHAQKVQNYSGTKVFETMMGTVAGTEKYPYITNDRGKRLKHGSYSFSGKDAEKSNRSEYSLTYVLNANYKQGNLHGAYTLNENLTAKYYEWGRGWQSTTGSAKLTGTFADGKPAGTFTASYNDPDKLIQNGTVTMKNGKYVGSYYYKGNGDHCYEELQGQLTADGKLTGKWKYHIITSGTELNWVFENDVLISSDNGSELTPTAVQNIAKQYAQGKITEEQLQDKGYIIKKGKLDLDDFISYLVLNIGDYGFEKMDGWDFSEYESKEYIAIEAPNSISEEGLQYLINLTRNQGGEPKANEVNTEEGYTIWLNPNLNREYGYYTINCRPSFSEDFGFYAGDRYEVVLNKKQHQKLTAVQDSMAAAHARNFSTATFTAFLQDSATTMRKLISSNKLRKEEKETLENTIAYLNRCFNELPGYPELIGEENSTISSYSAGSTIRNNMAYGDTCYFIQDNKFMISRHTPEHIMAVPTELVRNINSYMQAINQSEQQEKQIRKDVASVCAQLEQLFSNTKDKTIKNYYKQLNTIHNKLIATDDIAEQGTISKEMLLILAKYDTIVRKNDQLNSNLPKSLKTDYQRMFTALNSVPAIDTFAELQKYTSTVDEFLSVQDDFKKLNKICGEVEKSYADLKMVCDAMPYKKQVNQYTDSFNSAKQITEISSLKELEDQLHKMQQLNEEMSSCKEKLSVLNKEYTSIVESDAKLKEQCGKPYADVYKAYKGIYDKEIQIQAISSIEDIENEIDRMKRLAGEQQIRSQYIKLRKETEQLNNDLNNLCASAKNCKRLCATLYKELPMLWDESADNINVMKANLQLLTLVKEQLGKQDLVSLDKQLKKAKKVEEFKTALGL